MKSLFLRVFVLLMALFAAQTAQAAGACSAYKGQVYLNELRIGASRAASTSNQVELFNSSNVPQSLWQGWRIAVYYSRNTDGTSVTSYNYKLSTGFTANGQFIYNSSSTAPRIYMRNKSSRNLVVALLDQNDDFIDYVALDNTIKKVPACMGTLTVNATAGKDTSGDVARLPDGGAWPAAVANTSAHTIGRTNVCSSGVNDLVVTSSVDVGNPTVNVTPVTYSVTVLNKSCTASIASIKLTASGLLTTNFSSLAFSPSVGSITAPGTSTPVWSIGTLAAGASASLSMVGTPKLLGALTAVASVSATGTTLANTSDDSASVAINVRDYNYVGFDIDTDSVTEGVDTTYSVGISADIAPASGKPITVNYTVTGTADSGDSNLASAGSVVIDPLDAEGDPNTATDITFTVKDDGVAEPAKSIIFTITSVSSADGVARIDTTANTMALNLADNDTQCLTDTFSTGTLDANMWSVAGVGFTPQVVAPPTVPSARLRLTDNASNRATFAQFKKWFPGAGNKVVVEFDFFGWGGSGADGVSVVLSDADVAPTPGGYGGSLGYANRSGGDGFGGGWLGIGLDEFGNYAGTGEGRRGYPAGYTPPAGANAPAGFAANSIAVRGSGVGQSAGYALLAKTGTLETPVKTGASASDSTTRHRYRITLDHANNTNAYLTVERDTTGMGTSYATVVPSFDVKAPNSGQAPIPTNMLLSFTGSTGGSTNNHEIGNVKVCATKIEAVGNAAAAASFECMDDYLSQASYNNRQSNPTSRNPIYTKLAKTAFKLRVVPLGSDGAFKPDYIPAGGSAKNVTVEIFDDSPTPRPACNAYPAGNLVATQTATLVSGVMTTGNFTVNKAYTRLICRVTDNAVSASPVQGCSSDPFAVRPGVVTLVTTPAMATAPSASATPTVKAGVAFTLRATTSTASTDAYSGTLTQTASALSAQTSAQDTSPAGGGVVGVLSPASLVANASPSNNASYAEVGYLYLAAGAYQDASYTAVDGATDCVSGSTSVTLSGGKYGCIIGNASAVSLGRFVPDHFQLTPGVTLNRSAAVCSPASSFTYAGEELQVNDFKLTAKNGLATPSVTKNYTGVFARLQGTAVSSFGFGVVDLADATPPTAAKAFVNGTAAGEFSLVSSSGAWGTGTQAGIGTFSASFQLNRAGAPDGPYESLRIGAEPVDQDGVTVRPADKNLDTTVPADSAADKVLLASAVVRFGRLLLQNAYGSERLALSMPLQSQYWVAASGTGGYFKLNADDSCTPVLVPTARLLAASSVPDGLENLYFYPVVSGKTELLMADATPTVKTLADAPTSVLNAGQAKLQFAAPLKRGWLDIILGTPDSLKYNWGNCNGQTGLAGLLDDMPCARATFGIYKSPLIYRRENY